MDVGRSTSGGKRGTIPMFQMWNGDHHGNIASVLLWLGTPPRDYSVRSRLSSVGYRNCLHAFKCVSCTRPATWPVAVTLRKEKDC